MKKIKEILNHVFIEGLTGMAWGLFSTLIIVVSNLILLLKFDLGVTGYVCSIIISDALSLLGLIVISELYKFFDRKALDKNIFKELIKYSLPLVPTYILWWITSASDRSVSYTHLTLPTKA